MWLVIASLHDDAALWAYRGLAHRAATRGHHVEIELVTTESLGLALRWQHFVDAGGARIVIELADGRCFDSAGLLGRAPSAVLNRLQTFPLDHLPTAGADAEYARTELQAFYLSWLHGLPCPVLNPASPQGLCGRWRHLTEWLSLAGSCGLDAADYRFGSTAPSRVPPTTAARPGQAVGRVIVVGERVVTASDLLPDPLPDPIRTACLELSARSETPLLGIDLAVEDGTFVGADPYPDLRLGGERVLAALESALGEGRAESTSSWRAAS